MGDLRWGGAFIAMCFCAGCSLLTSWDEFTEGNGLPDAATAAADATADGAAIDPQGDAGLDASRSGDSSTPPGGLLTNPGFEASGTNCAPEWISDLGSAEVSSIAHGGTKACKICVPAGGQFTSAFVSLPYQPGLWTAEAWFHPPESGTAVGDSRLVIAFLKGGVYVDDNGGGDNLGSGWVKTQTSLSSAVTTSTSVHIEIGGQGAAGSCVIVDDVLVRHQ